MNKFLKSLFVASMILSATGCGSSSKTEEKDLSEVKIGVHQLMNHVSLNESYEGFKDVLIEAGVKEENIDYQIAGDPSNCNSIADKQANDDNDLIYAITTPCLQAAAASTTEIPIIGGSVTDFEVLNLIDSNEKPGGNITGTSDLIPVKDEIKLLKELKPDTKTVAIMYTTSEDSSAYLSKIAEEGCKELGLEPKIYTISDSNDIIAMCEKAISDKVDAVYISTDNTLATYLTTVVQQFLPNKIPVVVGAEGMVKDGGLCTYGFNYYALGKKAGKQALKILKGEATPDSMPIEFLPDSDCKLYINLKTAKECGIEIDKSKYPDATFFE